MWLTSSRTLARCSTARQQRLLRVGFIEALADHLRLGEASAVAELEEGRLAHGRACEVLVGLPGSQRRVLVEGDAFLEQHDAHLVVVVADAKAAQLEHGAL